MEVLCRTAVRQARLLSVIPFAGNSAMERTASSDEPRNLHDLTKPPAPAPRYCTVHIALSIYITQRIYHDQRGRIFFVALSPHARMMMPLLWDAIDASLLAQVSDQGGVNGSCADCIGSAWQIRHLLESREGDLAGRVVHPWPASRSRTRSR